MRNNRKTGLTLLLCLVLCLSLFPAAALAEGPEETSETEELEQAAYTMEEEQEESHEHSFTVVVTEPTCTEQGYTTYTCECGDSYVDDYTDALNHPEFIDVPEVPVTENGLGATAGKKCAVCGEILEGCDEIPALEESKFTIDEKTDENSLSLEKTDIPEIIVEETEDSFSNTFSDTAALSGTSMAIYSDRPSSFTGEKCNLVFEVYDTTIKESDILSLDWFVEDTNIADFETIPSMDSGQRL